MGQENQRNGEDDSLPSRDCRSPGTNRGCDGISRFCVLSLCLERFPPPAEKRSQVNRIYCLETDSTDCCADLLRHQTSVSAPTSTVLHRSTRSLCLASFTSFWMSTAALHNNICQFSLIMCCKSSNLPLQNRTVFTKPGIFTQRETEVLRAGRVV